MSSAACLQSVLCALRNNTTLRHNQSVCQKHLQHATVAVSLSAVLYKQETRYSRFEMQNLIL